MALRLTMREIGREIGGTPIAPDRGGYTLTMREDSGAADVLRTLASRAPGETRLHLGWGSFRNLDIAAACRSSHLFLCDINLHQLRVWEAVEAALATSRTPEGFVEELARGLPTAPPLRQFAASAREWLRGDLRRRESWLREDAPERFDHVRSLFARGAAGFACLDIRGAADGFEVLASRLVDLGIAVDTLYVSNLAYMLRRPRGFFGEPHGEVGAAPVERMWSNLGRVANDETSLVCAERLAPESSPDDLRWRTEVLRFPDAMRRSLSAGGAGSGAVA